MDSHAVCNCFYLYLWRLLRLAGQRTDSLLHCNSRSVLVDKHQPDDFHTASVYRPAGIPLQKIPCSVVPVLDALSVSYHLLRTAECIHDLHLLNAISLNWCVFAGILAGAGIVFFRQAVLKKGYKLLISVGFTLIVMYQYYMYFLIYPDLNIESLYLPNFLKGIGHGVLYISLTIYVAKHIPFKHFFQSLCVLSFIRTSIATPLGAAILNRWMKHLQRDNWGLLSRDMDNLHEWMPDVSVIQLYNEVNTQTMLTSLKELFGWVCLLGTIFLVIVLSYRIWRDRHLAALKMLHSLPVKKRYRPSSVHRISKN